MSHTAEARRSFDPVAACLVGFERTQAIQPETAEMWIDLGAELELEFERQGDVEWPKNLAELHARLGFRSLDPVVRRKAAKGWADR
jgi:hypothetical protein